MNKNELNGMSGLLLIADEIGQFAQAITRRLSEAQGYGWCRIHRYGKVVRRDHRRSAQARHRPTPVQHVRPMKAIGRFATNLASAVQILMQNSCHIIFL